MSAPSMLIVLFMILVFGTIIFWKLFQLVQIVFPSSNGTTATNSVTSVFLYVSTNTYCIPPTHSISLPPPVPVVFSFQYGIHENKGFTTINFPAELDLTNEPGHINTFVQTPNGLPFEFICDWDNDGNIYNCQFLYNATNTTGAIIRRSTNLVYWTPLTTNCITTEQIYTYSDTNPPANQAFYRIVPVCP